MLWLEIKITFSGDHEDLIVELISDLFYSLGAKGVVVDDPHLGPEEGWGADALPRPAQPGVTGYLPVDERAEEHRRFLADALAYLAAANDFSCDLTVRTIAEEDWAESWKAFFFPVKIGGNLVIKPTWRAYDPEPDELVIEIDPGMAFGTGAHPTTTMCLQLLADCLRPGDAVLDVGTGSGILLIAAAKLGAGSLCGVDIDPVAVDVARANLLLNGLAPADFDLFCGPLAEPVRGRYDVVVANILADVVIELLDPVRSVLKPGGLFICSGIVAGRRGDVITKMADHDMTVIRSREKEDWATLAARWSGPPDNFLPCQAASN